MAKQKRERALFELLAQERARSKAELDAAGRPAAQTRPAADTPAPRTRMPGAGRAAEPGERLRPAGLGVGPAEPRLAPAGPRRKPLVTIGGVGLGVHHLVIAAVVLVCLLYLSYLLGARWAGPDAGLPDVPAKPTIDDVRSRQPREGLVAPGPGQPPLGRPTEPTGRQPRPQPTTPARPAERPTTPGVTPTPGPVRPGPSPRPPTQPVEPVRPAPPEPVRPAPAGPQYRVRIQRLDVSQPDAIDAMRAFLARSGIETDLETRSGYHVLYSRKRFAEKQKADELADQVNRSLAAFETETGRRTSKDAYTVQVQGE